MGLFLCSVAPSEQGLSVLRQVAEAEFFLSITTDSGKRTEDIWLGKLKETYKLLMTLLAYQFTVVYIYLTPSSFSIVFRRSFTIKLVLSLKEGNVCVYDNCVFTAHHFHCVSSKEKHLAPLCILV